MKVLLLGGLMREVTWQQLDNALSTKGIRVWVDWPISSDGYRAQILSMMNEADSVIFLVDGDVERSTHRTVEWGAARQTRTHKLVVHFRVSTPCPPDPTFTYVTCQEPAEIVSAVINFVSQQLELKLFVSYSHEDRWTAGEVVRLAHLSLSPVWIDKSGLSVGKSFPPTLEAAIEGASRFLIIWSKHALTSVWVEREWRHALSKARRIAPLLVDNTPLPAELADLHAFKTLNDDTLLDWLSIPDATRSSFAFRAGCWWRRLWFYSLRH